MKSRFSGDAMDSFKLIDKNGNTISIIYCRKTQEDFKKYITLADFERLDHIEVFNKGCDKVKHKSIPLSFLTKGKLK